MKYTQIRIDGPHANNIDWKVTVILDGQDRVSGSNTMLLMGGRSLYWCPETEALEEGFDKLKQALVDEHEKLIKHLQEDLKKIKELKLP